MNALSRWLPTVVSYRCNDAAPGQTQALADKTENLFSTYYFSCQSLADTQELAVSTAAVPATKMQLKQQQ